MKHFKGRWRSWLAAGLALAAATQAVAEAPGGVAALAAEPAPVAVGPYTPDVTPDEAVLGDATVAAPARDPRYASAMPPSWRVDRKPGYEPLTADDDDRSTDAPRTRAPRPWYVPRVAVGMGLNVPELVPFEGYLFFGKYVGLRLFYTPPLPFNIRVEMPSDVISTKKGIAVANPDFTIRLKAIYGAHYGAEALVFPFGGSFFLMGGMSHRRMKVTGDAKSPILVCSLIEAAKEPPCGNPDARIETRTELEVHAEVETTALLARAGLGWFWHVGSWSYFMFNAGATKPTKIHREADVSADLDTHSSDPEITGALETVKAEREADMESKAIKAMRPVDEKILPILGLAAGVRF